jgi:hypothetical protein
MASSPSLICAARAGAVGVGRVNVTITNQGVEVVALGATAGMTFTSASWRLQSGESLTLPTTAAIYGVCDVGKNSVVDFIEVF